MRIGVDVSTWFNGRGFGRFTRELVSAMIHAESAHHWVLFSDRPDIERITAANVSYVVVQQSVPVTEAAVADGSRRVVDSDCSRQKRTALRLKREVWIERLVSICSTERM